MKCYCSSKTLYSNESSQFLLKTSKLSPITSYRAPLNPLKDPLTSKNLPIFQKAFEIASIAFLPHVPKINFLDILANPLSFYRDFIAKNFPCIITNAVDSWIALDEWEDPFNLISRLSNKPITVDITPDGFADSLKNSYFIEPYQEEMSIKEFLLLEDRFDEAVGYIQKQNDNLKGEFNELMEKDIDMGLCSYFSKKVFNKQADACNFWMGTNESVSSLHKDPYENIYAVLQGEKHFTLIPPICYPSLYEGDYQRVAWEYDIKEKQFFVKDLKEKTLMKWLSVNPDLEGDKYRFKAITKEELFKEFHVVVGKGEVLYLPAGWFHQVSQDAGKGKYTMAVNFWFDMEFGNGAALIETLKSLD